MNHLEAIEQAVEEGDEEEIGEYDNALGAIIDGTTDFIEELYEEHEICCFAIDESHCVSQWSDISFRPEYGKLNVLREIAPEVPILALTATASEKIQNDITKTLNMFNTYIMQKKYICILMQKACFIVLKVKVIILSLID